MNDELEKSVKTNQHQASSIGRKVKNTIVELFLTFLGAALIVFVVDYFMLVNGTWSGWQKVSQHPSLDDIAWWKSQVGPLPPPSSTGVIVQPANVRGINGASVTGAAPITSRLIEGLLSVKLKTESKWIRGGVLVSPTKHAWHIGVQLPGGMAFQRYYIGTPGLAPKHPAFWSWDFRILPIGLAINSLYAAAPFIVIVTIFLRVFRRIRARIRRARGQCEACAYILIAEQKVCSECGHHRQPIEQ